MGPWCPFCLVNVTVGASSTWLRTWDMSLCGGGGLVFGWIEEEVKKGGQGHLHSGRDVIEK